MAQSFCQAICTLIKSNTLYHPDCFTKPQLFSINLPLSVYEYRRCCSVVFVLLFPALSKAWPEEWTKSLIIMIPGKGTYAAVRTISPISHPSKIMLRFMLNQLKGKAEELLSEEQAGFRPKRGTTEQIFNIRLLMEKHVDHHQDLYHNFIDFKKAFDHVWHKGLWQVMRRYNIDEGLVTVLESLYGVIGPSTRRRSWTIVSNISRSTPGIPFVASAVQPIP